MSEFVDQSVIDGLKELGGDEFIQELSSLFLTQSKEIYDDLKNAVTSKDHDKIYKSSHKLKGSCLNIGAGKLSEISKILELKGKTQDLDGVDVLFIEFTDIYNKTMEAFTKYL